MPLYEYACAECDRRFDARRDVGDPDPSCPSCASEDIRRVFSVFAATGGTTSGGRAGTAAAGACACGGACACRGH